MGAYIKQNGEYSYNAEESYNYEINGFISAYQIISTPNKTFCGNNLTYLLSNTIIRLTVQQVPGGFATQIDVNLLEFLGDSATFILKNDAGTETLWGGNGITFSFSGLITDYIDQTHMYDIPSVVETDHQTVRLYFSGWLYRNTFDNITSAFTFDFSFDLYPQLVQVNGEITDISATTSEEQFNIAGRYISNADHTGALLNYIQNFTFETNLGDFDAWDLLKYGYTFTPDKNGTANTFSGSLNAIAFQSATTYFSGSDNVGEDATKVTLSFSYFDTVSETEKSASVVCELRLYGLTGASIFLPQTDFAENNFNINAFSKSLNDSVGNNTIIGLLDTDTSLFVSQTTTITNTDTNTDYITSDTLPHGHYKIRTTLVVNSELSISSDYRYFNVYDDSVAELDISSYATYYRINQEFSPSAFDVRIKKLIYGNDYYEERIFYPQYTTNYDWHIFDVDDVPSVDITFTYIDENNVSYTKTITMNVVAPTSDKVYIFDKKTMQSIDYGEMQQGFNFNFVLDQTKDNAKIDVLNHKQEDVKPFTIVYLESTNTWWIVKSDDVTRYDSESVALYKHSINLIGAIEILNARDLTNCGFNVDHYTIDSFFTRLLSLSDFELPIDIDYGTYLDPNKKVDYLKTFENYSPLSALKEMCNGMNVKPELNFVLLGNTITKAILSFVPNSGTNAEEIDISVFNDSQEKITNDKENYGSKVVSNIQNCTSGETIRFPANGTVALSGEGYKLTYENACIRLPSKAKEVKEVDICGRYALGFGPYEGDLIQHTRLHTLSKSDVFNEAELDSNINDIKQQIENSGYDSFVKQTAISYIENNLDEVKRKIQELGVTKLYNGALYDTQIKSWNGKQVPINYEGTYEITNVDPGVGPNHSNCIGLNEKRYYDTFSNQKVLTYWEQGSDLIKNFYWFDSFTGSQTGITWEGHNNQRVLEIFNINYNNEDYKFVIVTGSDPENGLIFWTYNSGGQGIGFSILGEWAARYVVHYVPQEDLKVKVENGILDNDTNLYNQNGTLVSAKAVSKLLNSHATAISSNQLTRYKRYYSYSNIPKIGQIVDNNGVKYVINNVSIDFAENDSNLYALDCMFTLTKQIACKSTMISANSVIRDYPTPQNNNIRRIQCYRDYIVLSYDSINEHNSYMPIGDFIGYFANQYELGKSVGYTDNHTAFIQVYFIEPSTSMDSTYYYQLPTIKMNLNKMFVEIVDFKDNNIIGYSGQNTSHPFTFSEWYQAIFSNDRLVIPISYVDSVGELIGINLLFSDNKQVSTAFEELAEDEPTLTNLQGLYNADCVIPSEVYEKVRDDYLYDFGIYENSYFKDGLEIPVFQYSCQINSVGGIEISSNIIKGDKCESNETYIYRYKVISNAYINEENALLYADSPSAIQGNSGAFQVNNNVRLAYNSANKTIDMSFYTYVLRQANGTDTIATIDTFNKLGKSIIIYRTKVYFTNLGNMYAYDNEFVMALNNCNQSGTNGQISINVSSYKLK